MVNLNTDVPYLLLCETMSMLFIAIKVIVDQYKAHLLKIYKH